MGMEFFFFNKKV